MTPSDPHPALSEALTKANHVAIFMGRYCASEPRQRALAPPVLYHDFLHVASERVRHWTAHLDAWSTAQTTLPTPLHEACALLDRVQKLAGIVCETSEGTLERAGLSPEKLVNIQGSVLHVTCTATGTTENASPHFNTFARTGIPPQSPYDGWWKPGPLMVGESFSELNIERIQALLPDADLIIAAGSELLLQPASSFPFMAARLGVPYFVVHDGPTAHDDHPLVSHRINAPAPTILPPAILAALTMNGLL